MSSCPPNGKAPSPSFLLQTNPKSVSGLKLMLTNSSSSRKTPLKIWFTIIFSTHRYDRRIHLQLTICAGRDVQEGAALRYRPSDRHCMPLFENYERHRVRERGRESEFAGSIIGATHKWQIENLLRLLATAFGKSSRAVKKPFCRPLGWTVVRDVQSTIMNSLNLYFHLRVYLETDFLCCSQL